MRVAINYATWKTRARALAVRFLHLAPSEIYSPDTPTISRKTRCKWQLLKARWIFEGFSSEREPIYQSLFTSYNREIVFSFFFLFFLSDQKRVTKVWPLRRVTVTLLEERERDQQLDSFIYETHKKKRRKKPTIHLFALGDYQIHHLDTTVELCYPLCEIPQLDFRRLTPELPTIEA